MDHNLGQWKIEKSGSAREGETVERLKTDLEQLEVFVREVVQNSLDAGQRDGDEAVRLVFRFRQLAGDEKSSFLQGIDCDTYRVELQESRNYQLYRARERSSSRPLPVTISEDAISAFDPVDEVVPLNLLLVEDYRTCGLTGEEVDYGEASRFCACCKDSDFSVRESGGNSRKSGGSYGKGKNVLWQHADSRLVLFYSHLSQSWNSEDKRFIGVGRLPWHADWQTRDEESRKNGRCYFGSRNGHSILGDGAVHLAKHLGIERTSDATGTTICLVGFDPLGIFAEEREPSELASDIAHIAETWYWPAIFEGRLEMTVVDEVHNCEYTVDPFARDDLKPFMSAWEACTGSNEDPELHPSRELSVAVPRGPGDEPEKEAKYLVGCTLLETEPGGPDLPPRREPGVDCVALVRGFGMVVEYKRVKPKRLKASAYVAVCRAGLAIPDSRISENGESPTGEERLESLLSSAEPPAHDKWNPVEIPSKEWPSAQARMKDFLKGIEEAVSEMTTTTERSVPGESMPEISRLFRFGDGPGAPRRTSKLSIIQESPPELRGDSVFFSVAINPLDGVKEVGPDLRLRFQAELLDSVAGPVRPGKGETIPVLSVTGNGDDYTGRLKELRSGGYELVLGVEKGFFPLLLVVESAPQRASRFEAAHYGLTVKAAMEGVANGGI